MPGADYRLVLASGSPQRREILNRLGLDFEVVVSDVPEVACGEPEADVLENARRKAAAVQARLAAEAVGREARPLVVIAGDTDVVDAGRILGKPADEREARDYLRRLSGRDHEVIGAVVILGLPSSPAPSAPPAPLVGEVVNPHGQEFRPREGVARSLVRFRELSEERIDWYVGTGEWRGRAGGYAIQGYGSALVAGVDGDLSNVIGLPVPVLVELATEIFG